MMDGFASSAWLDWSNILSSFTSLEKEQQHSARRLLTEEQSMQTETSTEAETHERNAASLQRLLVDTTSQLSIRLNTKQPEHRSLTSSSHSNYKSGGYDPYNIGCEDTKTCGGFPIWGVLLLGLAFVSVGALAVVFRNRAMRSKAQQSAKSSGSGGASAGGGGGYGTLP
jgi:hypothetical protein